MPRRPRKYLKVDGVTKLNPEYTVWKQAQDGKPATTVPFPNDALPVVSNMEDHADLCGSVGDTPLSESTEATIEMMHDPEISMEAGMAPDTMSDELGVILNKYEVPMGLMNKLMMISEFDVLEFLIDDSGSMSCASNTIDVEGRPQTRWEEAQNRIKEMLEILAYIPFQEIQILFLNRSDHLVLCRDGNDPKTFLDDTYRKIDLVFSREPSGTTPYLDKIQDSIMRGFGKNVSRYFFGDGIPNGGATAKEEIVSILCNRQEPEMNPVTFLSCTNESEQVEWMKEAEEIVPYCAECDDFKDEAAEVLRDQGAALPFSKGFYLICSLVAAMNPEDLDAMDECVPFTKSTLDNILGVQQNEASYRHYFNHFIQAQQKRPLTFDENGRPKKSEQIKKGINWESSYQEFLRAPLASQIPAVKAFKAELEKA